MKFFFLEVFLYTGATETQSKEFLLAEVHKLETSELCKR